MFVEWLSEWNIDPGMHNGSWIVLYVCTSLTFLFKHLATAVQLKGPTLNHCEPSEALSLGCTLESLGECLKIPALARTLPQTSYNQNLWVWGPSREPPLRASMEIALAQESGDLDDIPQSKSTRTTSLVPKVQTEILMGLRNVFLYSSGIWGGEGVSSQGNT